MIVERLERMKRKCNCRVHFDADSFQIADCTVAPVHDMWDNEREEWYFSIVDVVGSLTESNNPRDYWYRVKKRMSEEERSELSTFCRQLKLKSTDGKSYKTDVADMQGIFRIIQSVPSPKAEPFKMWLAEVGKKFINKLIDYEIVDKDVGYICVVML